MKIPTLSNVFPGPGQLPDRKVISVIVPVRNEAPFIEKVIRQLLLQRTSCALEIIIVDGRSSDNTREIVAEYSKFVPSLMLLDNPKRLSSAARNIGIRRSSGDYIIVVDGHCEIDDEYYLAKMVDLFETTEADCLGRPQPLEAGKRTVTQAAISVARKSRIGHNPASWIFSNGDLYADPSSVAVAYKRSLFNKVGFFDERFDACEDVELNQRISSRNFSCFFSDKIKISYVPRASYRRLFLQMKRYGTGRARLGRKQRVGFSFSVFCLLFFLVFLLSIPFCAYYFAWVFYAQVALLFFYLGICFTQAPLNKHGPATALLVPPTLGAIHLGIATGFIIELFQGVEARPC